MRDLRNQQFGRLLVVKLVEKNSHKPVRKRARWACICDCGTKLTVIGESLIAGNTRSCGCLRTTWKPGDGNAKHGQSRVIGGRAPEYRIWAAMLRRCGNPSQKDYKNYGGRGIRVCSRWKSFSNFFADMGKRPSAKHSIDRIDNDGNYEPGNCHWATRSEQQINKRRKVQI